MIRIVTSFVVSAALGVAIPICALIVLGDVTMAVMRPEPPPWVRDHLSISLNAIEVLAWFPPVLISALIIRGVAQVHAVVFGFVAGLFAIGTLIVVASQNEQHPFGEVISAFGPEVLLLILVLPVVVSVVRFKRVG